MFKTEIDYYTSLKSAHKKKEKELKTRHESSNPSAMFEHLLKMAETKDKNNNMPVRKFFQNTFENRLNDAIFALKRKQGKETESKELFTHQGQIKFIADYLIEKVPDGELVRDAMDEDRS